jgi:hypothetical protein
VTAPTVALHRAAKLLSDRLAQLETRLAAGEDLWSEYIEAVEALARLAAATAPGTRGELLTTKQLAESLAISTRQVRRLKAAGKITPSSKLGARTLRWRAEAGRPA